MEEDWGDQGAEEVVREGGSNAGEQIGRAEYLELPNRGSKRCRPPPEISRTTTSHLITEYFQKTPKRSRRMMLGEEQDDLLGADGDWPSFEEKMASIVEPANTPPT